MFKKFLPLMLTLSIIIPFFTQTSVFAADPCKTEKDLYGEQSDEFKKCQQRHQAEADVSGSVFSGSCREILGLTSWDCGVENINDEESLKNGIWQIAANIAADITVIAAYLVLGYVIYGGYLYIFSTGEPGKAASGKKTLTQAFIGLAIVMSAYLIMSSIRFALLGANNSFSNCATQECINPTDLVTNAIQWVIGIAGVVAAIFVVYGGISYATSSGDPTKLQKAKQTIIYALIGMIIVGLAEIITGFVSGIIRNADQNAASSNQQIIASKEYHEIKTI